MTLSYASDKATSLSGVNLNDSFRSFYYTVKLNRIRIRTGIRLYEDRRGHTYQFKMLPTLFLCVLAPIFSTIARSSIPSLCKLCKEHFGEWLSPVILEGIVEVSHNRSPVGIKILCYHFLPELECFSRIDDLFQPVFVSYGIPNRSNCSITGICFSTCVYCKGDVLFWSLAPVRSYNVEMKEISNNVWLPPCRTAFYYVLCYFKIWVEKDVYH